MSRRVLDSCFLIEHWRRCRGKQSLEDISEKHVRAWARKLIALRGSNAIVSPVALEMICGVVTRHELKLTQAYLGEFSVIDRGDISKDDWKEAARLAARVPRQAYPRDLGDCLIRAIANRLGYEVDTNNANFPK